MTDTPGNLILDEAPPRSIVPLLERFAGPALILLAAIAMAAWTWGTWSDPITSSGRELYVPWQIVHGKVLYRDLPHTSGPFSQYFNAMMFRLLGVSARTLILSNLLWLTALIVMVWKLWTIIADRIAATVACLLLVLLFSFIQLTLAGGFNFALPYSHEMTHGLILSFGAITALAEYLRRRSITWLAIVGALLGLVFLTRAELFVAIAPPVIAGAVIGMYRGRFRVHHVGIKLAALFGAMVLPALAAMSLLRLAMPLSQAFDGVLGNWKWAFDDRIVGLRNFQRGLGVDRLEMNVDQILLGVLGYALLLGPPTIVGYLMRRCGREGRAIALVATLVAIVAATFVLYNTINFQYGPSGLGIVLIGLAVALGATMLVRARGHIDDALILRLTLVWFALLLLVRMGMRVVLFEYGFALAMPAALLCATAAVGWLPRAVDRAAGFGWVPRAAVMLLLAIFVGEHLRLFGSYFLYKPVAIGEGGDVLHFDPRGRSMQDMLTKLDSLAKEGQTLAVFPEAAFINYYSAMPNPTGYVNLMPPDMLMFGQAAVLAALRRTPPDWIVATTSNADEFGYIAFETDYGHDVWEWMRQNYTEVATTGDRRFWMTLYRRNGKTSSG